MITMAASKRRNKSFLREKSLFVIDDEDNDDDLMKITMVVKITVI